MDTFSGPFLYLRQSFRASRIRVIKDIGFIGASTYNTRPLIPEVMVKGKTFSVIRDRISVDELLAFERGPSWLSKQANTS